MKNENRFQITSSQLRVGITTKGGQVFSVKNCAGHEFLWQPNPAIWDESAPFLFPYVGKSLGDQVYFHNRAFSMPVHGFSGGLPWECADISENRAVFRLCDNESTRTYYPFSFKLQTTYHAVENTLIICREICNSGTEQMPFTMGEHIGLRTNLRPDARFDQHCIRFEKAEASARICTTQELFLKEKVKMEWEEKGKLALRKSFFAQVPVLILEAPRSSWVELDAGETSGRVRVNFGKIPYLLFWSPPGEGDFVCVEPCWGTSSWTEETMDGYRRRGVILLAPGETYRYVVQMTFIGADADTSRHQGE